MQRYRLSRVIPSLAMVCILTGCAAAGEGASRDSNVLTSEEFATAQAGNLYEVVERLRPRWLQIRSVRSLGGGAPAQVGVFMNRSYLGGAESLRTLSLTGIQRMQYMDGPSASARLQAPVGVSLAGAILVETGGGP